MLKENKKILIVFIGMGIVCLTSFLMQNQAASPISDADAINKSIDTFIPQGHVLVPIQLVNAESLQNIVGRLGGVVDLYLPMQNKKSIKIANRVKLLKAPLNPEEFAVLVRETESAQILSYSGPFIAVIQNPNEKKSQVIAPSQKLKPKIEYYNE